MAENRVKLTFFDDFWVDFRKGITRRWYTPELYSISPSNGYATLLCDKAAGKYRLYYEQIPDHSKDALRYLCLLESEDMKTFTPVLNDEGGEVIFDGDGGLCSGTILYDEKDPDPSRRYKYCSMTRTYKYDPKVKKVRELTLSFSPDGIHWEHHPELLVHPHNSDALNKFFYNPCTEEYTLFMRSAFVDRRISIMTSKDLVTWTKPRTFLHPGSVYNNGSAQTEHYSLSCNWFDGIFYGLLWNYNADIQSNDYTKMFGVMDTELVYSYDGIDFCYTTGKPLVERPDAPTPGWAGMGGNDMCESLDGQYYFINMFSYQFVHGTAANNKRLVDQLKAKGIPGGQAIYRIRKDGFCGLESVGSGGIVTTKNMELLKDDLTFNVRADCGSVRFGLMDPMGNYLEGFSLDDCIPFEFNQGVEVKPQWKEKQLKDALGQRLRIVIELNGAVLHAMSATARPWIRQRQISFNNPHGMFE